MTIGVLIGNIVYNKIENLNKCLSFTVHKSLNKKYLGKILKDIQEPVNQTLCFLLIFYRNLIYVREELIY